MPAIQIDGVGTVQVGPEFLGLSPEDQNAFIGHIAEQAKGGIQSSLGSAPQATSQPPQQQTPTGPVQDLPRQPWSGGVLPVSSDSEGNIKFDPSAGLLGALTNAVTLPGDVYTGKADLNTPHGFNRAVGMGMAVMPDVAPVGGLLRAATAKDVQAPSTRALYDAANQGYDAARNMGVDYSSPAVAAHADTIQRGLEAKGFFREQAPQTHAILDKLQAVPDQPSVVSISSLDSARKGFGNTAGAGGSEGAAASIAKTGLDGFLSSPPPGSVVSGPAVEAAQAFSNARDNYAAASRSKELTNLETAASNRASASNSGQNVENLIRGRAATLLDPNHPERLAGFSPEERAALQNVNDGTATRNTLRFVGNLLGGGGGLGMVVTGAVGGAAGGAVGGPMGAAAGAVPPLVGLLAKKAASGLTERALANADELVRQRSPAFQGLLASAPPIARDTLRQQIMMRGLLDPYATNQSY